MMSDLPAKSASTSRNRRLDSWKEIADYLHVTDRTARSWEKDRGLPVHRVPGPRGRVWAFADELDNWMAQASDRPDHAEGPIPNKRLAVSAGSATLVCAALGLSAFLLTRPLEQINACHTAGRMLVTTGVSGRELWRVDLKATPIPTPEDFPQVRYTPFVTEDLDGDGNLDLLYPVRETSGTDVTQRRHELRCYNRSRNLMWTFTPGIPLTTRTSDTYSNNYFIDGVTTVRLRNGATGVIVISHHRIDSPAEIALLDARGNKIRAYYHFGHAVLFKLVDIDGDGFDELCIAGVANGFKSAVFLVLDPNRMEGCSREEDPASQLVWGPPMGELARVLLPSSSLTKASWEYGLPASLDRLGDEIAVGIQQPHNPDNHAIGLSFRFGLDLGFRRVILLTDSS